MGSYTANNYFYKPALSESGTANLAIWDAALDATDAVLATWATYLDQALLTSSTPTFAGLTIVNAITEFSTDGTLGGDSDSAVPTEKAVKTYVDAQIVSQNEFTELTDTPANYGGASTYMVRVNVGANALEFGAEGDIDHDGLTNYVADEHVAHSGVSVLAGTLLTGGGTIDGNVTLNVDEASIDHDSIVAGTIAYHDTSATGGELDTLTDGSNADALHTHASITDDKVKVDTGATADYIGAANSDGVLRAGALMTYVDGGNFVTINVDEAALTHDNLISGTIASHDTTATGAELNTLTGSGTTTLHTHAHDNMGAGTIAAHDTGATGTELDTLTDGSNADALHTHAASTDAKVGIDVGATPDYLGAAANDGALRVTLTDGITYTDGGNFVTIGLDVVYADITANDAGTSITAAELEELSDGSTTTLHTHSGIGTDEEVKIDAAATAGYIGAASNDGVLRVTTTNGLTYTDGGNFITIAFDADYTDISGNDAATDVTGAQLEELTDGSTTTLHQHSGGAGATLQSAFVAGQTITIADTDNTYFVFTNNDTTNNNDAFQIINASSGDAVEITQTGILATDHHALHISSNAINDNSNSSLVKFLQDNSSADQSVLELHNDGTGVSLLIDHDGASGNGLNIDYEGAVVPLWINSGPNSDYAINVTNAHDGSDNIGAIQMYTATPQTGGNYNLFRVWDNSAGSSNKMVQFLANTTGTAVYMWNNTGGNTLDILQGGVLATGKHGLNISSVGAHVNVDSALAKISQGSGATEPALEIVNAGTGHGIFIEQQGVLAASQCGLRVYSTAIQVNSPLVNIVQDHSSSSSGALHIQNDGTGAGIEIDQNGAADALYINQAANGRSLHIDSVATGTWAISVATAEYGMYMANIGAYDTLYLGHSGTVTAAAHHALYVSSNTADVNADSALVKLNMSNVGASEPALEIVHSGTGLAQALTITAAGTGPAFYMSTTGVQAAANPAFNVTTNAIQTNTISGYAQIAITNASSSGHNLQVYNAGTGRALWIDQNGAGVALYVDQAGNANSVNIVSASTTGTNLYVQNDTLTTGLLANFYSNSADANNRTLFSLHNDNTLATGAVLAKFTQDAAVTAVEIEQNGANDGLLIDQNGNGMAINIDTEATTAVAAINVVADTLTTGLGLRVFSDSASLSNNLVHFKIDNTSATANALLVQNDGTGVTIAGSSTHTTRTNPVASFTNYGTHPALEIAGSGTQGSGLRIQEQAAANLDLASYGQIWVKNDTPNTLYFTDDAGTDHQLGAGGASPASGSSFCAYQITSPEYSVAQSVSEFNDLVIDNNHNWTGQIVRYSIIIEAITMPASSIVIPWTGWGSTTWQGPPAGTEVKGLAIPVSTTDRTNNWTKTSKHRLNPTGAGFGVEDFTDIYCDRRGFGNRFAAHNETASGTREGGIQWLHGTMKLGTTSGWTGGTTGDNDANSYFQFLDTEWGGKEHFFFLTDGNGYLNIRHWTNGGFAGNPHYRKFAVHWVEITPLVKLSEST